MLKELSWFGFSKKAEEPNDEDDVVVDNGRRRSASANGEATQANGQGADKKTKLEFLHSMLLDTIALSLIIPESYYNKRMIIMIMDSEEHTYCT